MVRLSDAIQRVSRKASGRGSAENSGPYQRVSRNVSGRKIPISDSMPEKPANDAVSEHPVSPAGSETYQRVSRKASDRNIPTADAMPQKTEAEKIQEALTTPVAPQTEKPKKGSWRDNVTDAEKQRRRENVRKGVQAIGDVLRRMGNLYYTTRGASPQEYAYSPYAEWQREEREAKAHELAQQKIQAAKEKAEADNLYKMQNLELAKLNAEGKAKLNDANIELKGKQAELTGLKAELQKLINSQTPEEYAANMELLKKKVGLVEAQTNKTSEQTKWIGPVAQSTTNKNNASATSSYANARHKNTQTQGLTEGYIETNENNVEIAPDKKSKKTTNTKTKRVASKKEVKNREVKKKKKVNW